MGASESEAGVETTEKDRMVYSIKSCTMSKDMKSVDLPVSED